MIFSFDVAAELNLCRCDRSEDLVDTIPSISFDAAAEFILCS